MKGRKAFSIIILAIAASTTSNLFADKFCDIFDQVLVQFCTNERMWRPENYNNSIQCLGQILCDKFNAPSEPGCSLQHNVPDVGPFCQVIRDEIEEHKATQDTLEQIRHWLAGLCLMSGVEAMAGKTLGDLTIASRFCQPLGNLFLNDCKKRHRPLLGWFTGNTVAEMSVSETFSIACLAPLWIMGELAGIGEFSNKHLIDFGRFAFDDAFNNGGKVVGEIKKRFDAVLADPAKKTIFFRILCTVFQRVDHRAQIGIQRPEGGFLSEVVVMLNSVFRDCCPNVSERFQVLRCSVKGARCLGTSLREPDRGMKSLREVFGSRWQPLSCDCPTSSKVCSQCTENYVQNVAENYERRTGGQKLEPASTANKKICCPVCENQRPFRSFLIKAELKRLKLYARRQKAKCPHP